MEVFWTPGLFSAGNYDDDDDDDDDDDETEN